MTIGSPGTARGPSPAILLGVGLLSACILAQQVLLTRLLSAVLFYHFTFLAISLALLGTGAGGVAVYAWQHRIDRQPVEYWLVRGSLLCAAFFVVVPFVLVRLPYPMNDSLTFGFVLTLAATSVLALLPFLAAGVVITLAIRSYARSVGRVYAFDLVGAGIGAVAVVPVMWIATPATAMIALGVTSAVAAGLFASRQPRWQTAVVGVALAGCVAVGVSTSTSATHLASPYFPGVRPVADVWTPLDRILGYKPVNGSNFGYIFYDRVYAPVPVRLPGQPIPNWRPLITPSQSIGLAVAKHGRVLVIGGGGGRDIYDALSSGYRRVDVIELNTGIVNVVDNYLGKWSGRPYVAPRVHTVVGDGRAILASSNVRYNEIHIGFTDTLSGSSADAFALSEQNLYTVQAFEEYYDHLAPGGILNVTRQYHLVGDESLRITVMTLASLQDRGIRHPDRNVVVLLGHDQFGETPGTVLSQLTPFTPRELSEIRTLAAQRGAKIAYAPGGPYLKEWVGLHESPSWSYFCTHYRYDVCPSTDNQPFFYNMTRLADTFKAMPSSYVYTVNPYTMLAVTVAILMLLSLLAFWAPLRSVPKKERPPHSSLVYFAGIGLGFLILEVTLIQRFVLFLGFPTYALSVVLFALLIFTGLGSFLSARWRDPRRGLLISLGVAAALIALSAYLLQPLLADLITIPFAARVAITVALIAPVGLTLGTAMPIGLRRLGSLHPSGIPWAWGVNGIASVLAAAFGVFIAINWGFAVTTLVALGFYMVAIAHAAFGRWPDGAQPTGPTSAAGTSPRPRAAHARR